MPKQNTTTTLSHAQPASTSLEDILTQAMESPRKVFLLGFELRFPLDMPAPAATGTIEAFLKTLDEKFGPEGLDLDPRLVWRRLREEGKSPSCRCTLVVNGDRLGGVYGAWVIVQEAWNLALGLPEEPNYGLVGHGRPVRGGLGHEEGAMLWRDDVHLDAKLKDCAAWVAHGNISEGTPPCAPPPRSW